MSFTILRLAETFQLTPLHEGRLYICQIGEALQKISTHAPTRGATHAVPESFRAAAISTHAPTRGATNIQMQSWIPGRDFNSRPYTRGDLPRSITMAFYNLISTHAPTRGATYYTGKIIVNANGFQLTPLHEGRPDPCPDQEARRRYFNSRPYTRGDPPLISCDKKS